MGLKAEFSSRGRSVGEGARPAWHALAVDAVCTALGTDGQGLSADEVSRRLQQYGPNTLPVRTPPGLGTIILHQFLSPLIYILIVAAGVSLAIGEPTDACFIFAVILLNAGLGSAQEWKAERSAADLQRLLCIRAQVVRQESRQEVAAEELVPGDLVLLESGSRVPADLRLLEQKNLAIDESLLTGESKGVEKALPGMETATPLAERSNMAFAASTVLSGRARALVVATGLSTEVGQIAHAVITTALTKPPLLIRMERFARQISILVLVFIGLLALVGIAGGLSYVEVFFMAVALAVSAIPEGLPVAMTVALSIATSRMARRNVIVRKLTAVEGLGSCTCIASDKTGTLTVNRQTAKAIWLPGEDPFFVSGEGYAGGGDVLTGAGEPPGEWSQGRLLRLGRAVLRCNEADLFEEEGQWRHHGDPVDVALLALGYKMRLSPAAEREAGKLLGEIPFESERRFAARFHRREGQVLVAVKGAVEVVLPLCDAVAYADGPGMLDAQEVEGVAHRMAADGYRVIAVADVETTDLDPAAAEAGNLPPLLFLGLVGLIDPVRPEAREAVSRCHRAGVKVVMVTGDHPATAMAIASDLGLAGDEDGMVTGAELSALGQPGSEEYRQRVSRSVVFSRVTPLQKLDIVSALIAAGHFVAVTGDGVNDAPALRKANIGVAMGSGTDVAKDTASIIVTDDNFASIQAGIEEGRFAYDNIRKVIYLLISTGAAEIILFTLALLAGLPLPLLAVQLLWLNLVTNGIQDVALAFEGGEAGVMERPPRDPTEGVFNRLMVEQTVVSGVTMGLLAFGLWWWLHVNGYEEQAARNQVLLLMVLLENVHVFNCRSERLSAFRVPLRRNRLLVAGVVVAQGVHILSMSWPPMQKVLDVAPVSPGNWALLLATAAVLLLVMEIYKRFRSG